jgi:hypothetical protein
MRALGLLILLLGLGGPIPAQDLAGARNLDRGVLVGLGYGPFTSAGDLGDRFGGGFAVGGAVDYTAANSGWQFGLMAQYGFGSEVKEDVLASLRSSANSLIGNQREPADINLRQRQLFIGPRAGYTLAVGNNRRAGIQLRTAVGYFYSRIRIQQDPVQFVPQLEERLQAGYDRLAGGPAIYQFIGYQQLARDRRLNFFAGVEATAGFTTNLRSFDIPTGGPPPDGGRTDLVLGFRAGLILPIYIGEGREIFY